MWPITPNAFKRMRKTAKEAAIEYRAARAAWWACRQAWLADPTNGRLFMDRENAAYLAIDKRSWANTYAQRVDANRNNVEVGAKWSPNGLARVREANKRR